MKVKRKENSLLFHFKKIFKKFSTFARTLQFIFPSKKVGIQIGESLLKIVVIERKLGKWKVKKEISEFLPEGLVREGKILQPEILGLKIREVLNNHKIAVKKVSIFIEELPFFLRQITLNVVSKQELEKAIQYKAQLELPINIEELILHHSRLGSKIENEIRQDMYMVIAVYRSYIERAMQAIKQAGLKVDQFGLEPEALYNGLQYKKVHEHIEGAMLLVRKDSKRMMLAIFNNNKLAYSRYIPVFNEMDEELVDEIIRTIMSWNGKISQNKIGAVLLFGEKEDWSSTQESIESFMNNLKVQTISSQYTACLGISLKTDDDDEINIKPQKDTRKEKVKKIVNLSVSFLLLFLIANFIYNEYQLRKDIQTLTDKIHQSQELNDLLAYQEKLIKISGEYRRMIESSKEAHVDGYAIIENIRTYQPKTINISKIIFSKDVLLLSGTAETYDDVLTFYKQLQTDETYANVHLNQSSLEQRGIIFSIDIQMHPAS